MATLQVGVGKLKSTWSEYMRRVKNGDTIVIPKHGRIMAQITSVKPARRKSRAARLNTQEASSHQS